MILPKKIALLFNKTKDESIRLSLFVGFSFAALILAAIGSLLFRAWTVPLEPKPKPQANDFSRSADPLLTKKPALSDLIKQPLDGAADPSLGAAEAPVKIVIFSDFTCKFCAEQEQIINKLLTLYPGKIRLIWKDYPENPETSLGWRAALAGRCAQAQDRFWPMHDLLFQTKNLSVGDFSGLASRLGLGQKQFDSCLNDGAAKRLISDNIEEANVLNINGVPFIFVNGQELMGQISLSELKQAVEAELTKKQ